MFVVDFGRAIAGTPRSRSLPKSASVPIRPHIAMDLFHDTECVTYAIIVDLQLSSRMSTLLAASV